MLTRRALSIALTLELLVAACSSNDHAAPPQPSSSGGRASGGSSATANGGSAGKAAGGATSSGGRNDSEAGAAGHANEGGEAGSPSEPSPSLCDPLQSWGGAQRIDVSSFGADVLAGISGDERCIAWLADGLLFYAERPSSSADFGSPVPIPASDAYFAGATLSPDGLSIIGVRKDGKTFGELRRAKRSDPFEGDFNEAPFVALAAAPGSFRADGPFADPVLGADGLSLWFSALDAESDQVPSIYVATRLGVQSLWPFGEPLTSELLYAEAGKFRRPSGLSADARTLFYWDEVASEQRAAFRPFVSAPFDRYVSLDNRSRAVPNAACDRLYYSAPGTQGVDLFVEKRQ